ncbi:DUF732 domain-containing protein [Streptomyces sp. SP18ES09]|uniref:DUF732 domain-containing protein n=1 Tax=Streptomyces sp. SP18ES09 TaxID=3002532 RepID=UPI000E275E84|nr:DUF732 domain-containing protein [Streptomyces sp. SP18ES09]MEE1814308.1 DUF732 domain-containing protein [Streptomyces sp. SP18ES09]
MRIGFTLPVALLTIAALAGCSGGEQTEPPGPIQEEAGHSYSAEQSGYLAAVRDLDWFAGATEKDALSAALEVCTQFKTAPDPVSAAHNVMKHFRLDADDANAVVSAADVTFCNRAG